MKGVLCLRKKHNKFNLSLGFIIGIVFFGFYWVIMRHRFNAHLLEFPTIIATIYFIGATISFPFANTIVHERLKMTTTTLAPVIYCISPIILLLKLIFADEE